MTRWVVLAVTLGVVGLGAQPAVDPDLFPTADNPIYLKIDALQAAIESMRAYVQQALVNAPRNTPRRVLDPLRDAIALADTTIEQWWRWGRPKRAASTLGSLPLLGVNDIVGADKFDGGFLMPDTPSNGLYTEFGPQAIAYNSNNGKVFIAERTNSSVQYVSEMTIPALVLASSTATMNRATISQAYVEPTEGQYDEADGGSSPGAALWSIFVPTGGTRLYGSLSMFYDASDAQRKALFSRPLTLATTGDFKGLDQVGGTPPGGYAGHTSGYFIEIPTGIRSSLGGHAVGVGQCCQSIITRNSYGPAIGGVDLSRIDAGTADPHPWKSWIDYPNDHQTLGAWETQSTYFGHTTQVFGGVMFPNTRTLAFFGVQGAANAAYLCYGEGTGNVALHNTPTGGPGGEVYCYDPARITSKGNHNWPYRYFIWLYNIDHVIEAHNGTKQPWEVVPYGGGDFTFPISVSTSHDNQIKGVAYDVANNRLYLVQNSMETVGCCIVMGVVWRLTPDLTP